VLTPAAVWFYGGYSAALWAMNKVLISSIDMCLKKFAFGRVLAFCIVVTGIAFITTSTSMDGITLKLSWILSIIFKS
jgi:hypothetical protein